MKLAITLATTCCLLSCGPSTSQADTVYLYSDGRRVSAEQLGLLQHKWVRCALDYVMENAWEVDNNKGYYILVPGGSYPNEAMQDEEADRVSKVRLEQMQKLNKACGRYPG